MPKKISIIGLGRLGKQLALAMNANSSYEVSGSTKSPQKAKELAVHPFYIGRVNVLPDAIEGDWDTFIADAEYLVINIPPRRVDDIETVYPAQIEQVIERTPQSTKVIFVSSTSVYGYSEEKITEADQPAPTKGSGRALLAAEQLLDRYFGDQLTIVRLAGIIGPERHPGSFFAGKRVSKNAKAPVNLIHQSDAVALIEAVLEKDRFGEVFNGCSSVHPLREDFYKKAAESLNLPAPIFEGESTSVQTKIIDNAKSKTALDFTYQYDDPEQFFSDRSAGKISIVGAGPGDVKLLTIQALELLKSADVLLYDNLVSEEIRGLSQSAEHIYVGKRYGDKCNQSERQDNINRLLEKHYLEGKRVVRLKSGDPYIFGRAAEEAHYLVDKGLPFHMVPGISAALAAANHFNLPITERRKSSSLLICTAHTADYSYDQLKGIAELLKDGNSLAIYMGLKSLDKLIPKLIEVTGKPGIPISAISNVSRKDEKIVASTLNNIMTDLENNPLPMPVVFIVGVKPITGE